MRALLLALLALAAAGPVPDDTLLWDARRQDDYPANVARSPRLPAAEERRVLSQIAKPFLTDTKKCRDGQVVYGVNARVRGAFTGPGARETAYLVEGRRCESEVDLPFDSTHLLVFRDGVLVARAKGPSMIDHAEEDGEFHGTEIRAVADVDGDGVSEILALSGGFGQGIVEQVARLYSVKGGQVRKLRTFESVYVDDCNSSLEVRQVAAHVLRYAASGTILVESWVASCREAGEPALSDFERAAR
jgi:hypothetical protein